MRNCSDSLVSEIRRRATNEKNQERKASRDGVTLQWGEAAKAMAWSPTAPPMAFLHSN